MARSITKWLFATLACLILTVALLELSLPLLHGRYASYFRRSITASNVKFDYAQRFFETKSSASSKYSFVFDHELGWDKDPIARNYIATRRYFAQSYGDSFVEGLEVGPEDTWQAQFERLTGKAIVNLGVSGYGLDQAVLKAEKYASHYPTRLAILGLYHQPYRRALSYHSFYYFRNDKDWALLFKPMFVKRAGGFELIQPPCANAACLMQVLSNPNHEVWRWLAGYDHWYQANQKKPIQGFPNTVAYMRVLPELVRERREARGADNYFFVNSGALELIEYLIERFVNDSRKMGMTPVCVMLYSARDLQVIRAGIRLDSELLKFLETRHFSYVDTAPYILKHYSHNDGFESLNAPHGHMNGRGNLLVAEALVQGLASMGLLEY